MLNSGRIVGLTRTRSIRCYGNGEERGIRRFTGESLPSKRRRVKLMWEMRGFEFRLRLSLSLSLIWSSGLRSVACLLLIWPGYREICLLHRFSLLIGSDWVFSVFLPRKSRIGRKITFDSFYFLTNFSDISICAYPMFRNPFFPIRRKSQHR